MFKSWYNPQPHYISFCYKAEASKREIRRQFTHKMCPQYEYAAAPAKSLQLCPTLCDPIEGSPPGSPVPGILQARTLEWAAISFSNAWKWKVKVKSLSHVRLLAIQWTAAYQAPPSMEFSRQEYWSGLPYPCHSIKRLFFILEIHIGKLLLWNKEKKLNLFWTSKERVLKLNSTFFSFYRFRELQVITIALLFGSILHTQCLAYSRSSIK